MRGSSTPTPTPLNGEATKPTRNANQKGQEKGPIRKGKKKRQGKPPPYHQEGGGRGENVSTEERKTEVAQQPQRGGASRPAVDAKCEVYARCDIGIPP